ncbi:MAG: hypothetical protein HF978_18525 [Desulfobacteraceae bacterium]|nr:hypothetical protein [Desulfobacteraceae bacterium]MBC2757544.1 hypothetical protein [Desulfobacteraceae bacterium]
MKTAFYQKIKPALILRKQISIQSILLPLVFLSIFLVSYIFMALQLAPENNPAFHFGKERGYVTALSAIFLAMTSGFAWGAFFLSGNHFSSTKFFWLFIALAFGYLALDELMMFHERIGYWIKMSNVGPTETFRNWNDVIVISYGILALAVLPLLLPHILKYPKFGEMLTVAFIFYCIHTAIDSLTIKKTFGSIIIEESFKLFSSAFFSFSMLIGLLGVVASLRHENRE